MNYKKITSAVVGFLLLIMLVSCDALLDTAPQQSISEEEALTTPGNVRAALIGAYSLHRASTQYGGRYMFLPDLLADDGDVNWTGTFFQPREVFDKTISPDNSFTQSVWTGSYNTINRANNVLAALDVLDTAESVRVEGEALFLRGVAHFELVRVFGRAYNDGDPTQNPGVPIVTEPTRGIGDDAQIPRATVEQVYQQVISDLETARNQLPATNGIFATTYAASGMLARVHLMRGDYQNAALEANRVIESERFSLMSSFEEVFNRETSPEEHVYATRVTAQDGAHEMRLFYASSDFGGRADIDILDQHLQRYEDGDERADFFYTGGGALRTQKWQTFTNIPIIRLSEMYLIRAESNLKEGSALGDSPINDLNRVRNRAGLDDFDGDLSPQVIFDERRVELAFEGHLLHDKKRKGESVGNIPFDANQLVYPIPLRELEVNPNLVPNPGYGQ